jgi:copper(I)-binding protein
MWRGIILLLLAGCATHDGNVRAGDLEIHGAFAFAPPTRSEAAAYFTVVNHGLVADTLVDISSPIAQSGMLHQQVPEGGRVHMEHVAVPVVPAGDSLAMAPGGMHVMFTNLESLPQAGSSIVVRLRFARAGDVTIKVPVRSYGDAP